eukprot:1182448-Prorocentrum_minimum.AAC.28
MYCYALIKPSRDSNSPICEFDGVAIYWASDSEACSCGSAVLNARFLEELSDNRLKTAPNQAHGKPIQDGAQPVANSYHKGAT